MTDLWRDRLDESFVLTNYPEWAQGARSKTELCERFLVHGLPVLAAIEHELVFEPDYFIETHPQWEGCDPVDCYRAWLFEYSQEPWSIAAHLQRLELPLSGYPPAFPWRDYALLRPIAGAHRWAALNHFLESGFAEIGEDLPYGEGASEFLLQIARRYSTTQDALALKAFALAARYGAPSPEAQQHRADAYLRSGLLAPAQALYERVIQSGYATGWTVRNLFLVSLALDGRSAIDQILATAPALRADDTWRKTADEAIDHLFAGELHRARGFYLNAERALGDAVIDQAAEQIMDVLDALEPAPSAANAHKPSRRSVVMLVSGEESALKRYRIDDRIAQLAVIDVQLLVFHDANAAFVQAVEQASAIVFLNAAATPNGLRALHVARRFSVPTFYEAYGPIFDPSCAPPPLSAYGGFLTTAVHTDLTQDVALYRAFAKRCDFGLAPTRSIAQRLEAVVAKAQAFVLPDALSADVQGAERLRDFNAAPVLFLESRRFLRLSPTDQAVGAAIFACLSKVSPLTLVVGGYVQLDPAYDVFNPRIVELGPIEAPGEHIADLEGRVINIALTVETGDDASSSTSWLEAAARALPSVIDAEGGAAAGLTDMVDAIIVNGPDQWGEALTRLIKDAALGFEIGERAYRRASQDRSPETSARRAEAAFFKTRRAMFSWLSPATRSRNSSKL